MRAQVTVPASSANLGPGYDAFGLALGLYNTFEGELADEWDLEVRGEGAGHLSAGAGNPVALAMARLFAEIGRPRLKAEVVCHNGIPVGLGLGSSAAAIVGGLVLADALAGARVAREDLLRLAAEIEGHADNVAAALYGGFTVVAGDGEGLVCAHVEPAEGLAAIVVMGEHALPTAESRAALPVSVPHADAAANAARAALLALGVVTGSRAQIEAGLVDSIHERYRSALVPDLEAVRTLLGAIGAGPAVLSGAGPTVLSLISDTDDDRALARARSIAETARTALSEIGRTRVMALPVDRLGARQS